MCLLIATIINSIANSYTFHSNAAIMNDAAFGLLFLLGILTFFVLFPFILIGTVVSCIAWSRTRAWKKDKAKHFAKLDTDVELDGLIPEEQESEDEPIDSEDEREINERKEAHKQDWELTTYNKFKKEMKRSWRGEDNKDAAAKKEREERAKIAREVAREMLRAERKRERKMNKIHGKAQEAAKDAEDSEHSLPTYDVATSSST